MNAEIIDTTSPPTLTVSDGVRELIRNMKLLAQTVRELIDSFIKTFKENSLAIALQFREIVRRATLINIGPYTTASQPIPTNYDFVPKVDFDISITTNYEKTVRKKSFSVKGVFSLFKPLIKPISTVFIVINGVDSMISVGSSIAKFVKNFLPID